MNASAKSRLGNLALNSIASYLKQSVWTTTVVWRCVALSVVA